MKVAVVVGPRKIVFKEVEEPKDEEGFVVVKVKAVNICQSDLRKWQGISCPSYPIVLGHEIGGRVENRNVAINPLLYCKKCRYCLNGRENLCEGLAQIGGFSEFVKVPRCSVYYTTLSPSIASLVEPVAACLSAVEKTHGKVCIAGAGPMGIIQGFIAKFMGKDVVLFEPREDRREIASKLGLETREINDREKFDSCIISTSSKSTAEAIPYYLKLLNSGGTLVVFSSSWPPKSALIDVNLIHYKEIEIVGSFAYTNKTFSKAVEIAEKIKTRLKRIITHKFKFEEIEKAFEIAEKGECLKVQIEL